MEPHLRAMGCHSPYGITQCYLPSNTSEHITHNRQAATLFTYPRVDLGDWLHTEMVYPPTDGHLSKY